MSQMQRLIVTEKGNDFLKESQSLFKLMQKEQASSQKKSSHLPPLEEKNRYSILETINSQDLNPSHIKPLNKRAQSLFFYENNKRLMNFHNKSLKDKRQKLQKPTIFSKIEDPFNQEKWDFHQSSVNFLTTLNQKNNFGDTLNSQFLSPDKNTLTIDFTFYSPNQPVDKPGPLQNQIQDKRLINQMQKTFYTKPLVKNLNEIEIIDKVQSKKLDYFNDKYRYFEGLKDLIKTKKESKEVNLKSRIMEEFEVQEKQIEENLALFRNEKERFKRRLLKYNKEKFDCLNRHKMV